MDLIKIIKAERRRRGITQEQLSAMSGISKSQISHLENGYNKPFMQTLEPLLRALNLELTVTSTTTEEGT